MTPSAKNPAPARRRGFLLLEVVLALAVFGIAATGFAVALHRMADAAALAQQEMRLTRLLDAALEEALSLPTLEEGTTTIAIPGSNNMEIDTLVELITDLENEDGQLLQETYRITVTAHWYDGGWQERSVETWRYGRMYQPS